MFRNSHEISDFFQKFPELFKNVQKFLEFFRNFQKCSQAITRDPTRPAHALQLRLLLRLQLRTRPRRLQLRLLLGRLSTALALLRVAATRRGGAVRWGARCTCAATSGGGRRRAGVAFIALGPREGPREFASCWMEHDAAAGETICRERAG